ncbi:hypothetical protein SKAU_G00404710 [Synaphobranchus kaupii]|uniref:Endothelin-like toxin domain-containing protein n=1 Tax=Synaphobranchus kaupii TaxID=118154 RepID=A0A9Q1ICR4_SYNKA|nr:hypothetical protein SKAU_G00404710 [Synaphobranchus kaupii]
MDLALRTLLALSIALCVLLPEGSGLPASGRSDQGARPAPLRVRTKRCSCNNWLDRECIYFCHLDIIWVNTPSKTTPYGLGSPLSRRRRSTDRCACASPSDRTCAGFCHHSSENPELVLVNLSGPSLDRADRTSAKLLTSLREVVGANVQAVKRGAAPRRKRSGAPGRCLRIYPGLYFSAKHFFLFLEPAELRGFSECVPLNQRRETDPPWGVLLTVRTAASEGSPSPVFEKSLKSGATRKPRSSQVSVTRGAFQKVH